MKFILGEKLDMSQRFNANGNVIPITLVKVGPCVVTDVKTMERDGYTAVQLGYGTRKKKRVSKSVLGHLKDKGPFRAIREFRVEKPEVNVGDTITASVFAAGDHVKVTGTSKGKGFQGVVRRHGFHGSPKTHGHKDQLRMSGSIGSGGVQHVFKGTHMGGHMGDAKTTVKNLEIIEVNEKEGILSIKGAIPGARHGLICIET